MGKNNSKPLVKKSELMGCEKIMYEKHGEYTCRQLPLWVEKFGFPENGSFSVFQIQKLEENLEMYVNMNGKHKIDWVALKMWKTEAERRQRQQNRGRRRKRECGKTNPCPQHSHAQEEPDHLPASAAHQEPQIQQPVNPERDVQGQLDAAERTMPVPMTTSSPFQEATIHPSAQEMHVPVAGMCSDGAWTQDEMRLIASELPNVAKRGGAAFVAELPQVVQTFKPSLREIRSLLLHCMGLKWMKVKGDWPDTDMCYDWTPGAGYRRHVENLCERIKSTFPAITRWDLIHNCKQQHGEMVCDYLARLTKIFEENSGITPPADPQTNSPYEEVLKGVFLFGIDKQIMDQVSKSCFTYRTERLSYILGHAIHHEKQMRISEEKKQQARAKQRDKLDKELLRYLEEANKGGGRGRALSNQSHNAGHWGGGCWNCGDPNHWARHCNRPRQLMGPSASLLYLAFTENDE
ncbi:hypothetical protein ABVT39_025810 [Epinephelus coioides]